MIIVTLNGLGFFESYNNGEGGEFRPISQILKNGTNELKPGGIIVF